MNIRCVTHLAALLIAVVSADAARAQSVTLRRGVLLPQPLTPESLIAKEVTARGVMAADATNPAFGSIHLGWDQVASVSGELAIAAASFKAIADDAWRARTRLERGDLAGAEPLFEQLFERYEHETGPTAQAVAGGLLLCTVARGAQVSALLPWLAFVRTIEEGGMAEPRRIVRGGDVADPLDLVPLDRLWGLCPALPPIWLPTAAVRTVALHTPESAGIRAHSFRDLYAISLRFEVTPTAAYELPQRNGNDEGLALVWEVVASRVGDAAQRVSARAMLKARLSQPEPAPSWVRAWCQTALGRSLLREPSVEQQLLGVAELMSVPAAYQSASPYLAGIAMAQAAVALAELNDLAGARAIRAYIAEQLPGHPAMDWDRLQELDSKPPDPGSPSLTPPSPSQQGSMLPTPAGGKR